MPVAHRARTALGILLGAAMALSLLAPAGPPAAAVGTSDGSSDSAADGPVVSNVGTVLGHPELVVADVSSSTAITSVAVTLWHGVFSKEVPLHAEAGSRWRSEPLGEIPYGFYSATVTATNTAGSSTSPSVSINYHLVPRVVSVAMPTGSLGENRSTATATGELQLWDPRTRSDRDDSGGRVALDVESPGGTTTETVTVRADGTFSVTGTAAGLAPGDIVTVSLRWDWYDPAFTTDLPDPAFDDGGIARVTLHAVSTPTRVVLDHAAVTVEYPDPAVVTGLLESERDGVWSHVPNTAVRLAGAAGTATASTDGDGRFSFTLAPIRSATERVSIAEAADPWLDTTPLDAAVAVHLVARTRIPTTPPSATADGKVTLEGSLVVTPKGAVSPRGARVVLQESSNGRTAWHDLDSAKAGSTGAFALTSARVHPLWHVRAAFKGSSSLQPSTSAVYALRRRPTRIAHWQVTPRSVDDGARITLGGRLQKARGGDYVGIGKRTWLELCFRKKGSTVVRCVAKARTATTGAFNRRLVERGDGTWTARWSSNDRTLLSARSAGAYVDVD